jgi:hypothetical protein
MNSTAYGLPPGVRALILWRASVLKILKKPLGFADVNVISVDDDLQRGSPKVTVQ